MKSKFIVIIIFVLVPIFLAGQIRYFIELDGNYPIIPTTAYTDHSTSIGSVVPSRLTINNEFESRPGLELKLGVDIELSEKFSLETGIGVSQMFFKRKNSITGISGTNASLQDGQFPRRTIDADPIGSFYGFEGYGDGEAVTIIYEDYLRDYLAGKTESTSEDPRFADEPSIEQSIYEYPDDAGKTSLTYFTIPLKLNYKLGKKLLVGLGVNTSVLLGARTGVAQVFWASSRDNFSTNLLDRWNTSTEETESEILDFEPPRYELYYSKSKDSYNELLFSALASVQYQLNNSFALNLEYQHALNQIYQQGAEDSIFRTLKLGVRYYFTK